MGQQLTPDEFWQRMAEMDDQIRASFASRPVYGILDWVGDRMIAEWALGGGTLRSVRYDGLDGLDDVTVVVATADGAKESAADHLLLNLPGARELGFGGSTTEPDHRLPAPIAPVTISVSGTPEIFAGSETGRFGVASATVGEWEVAVCWRGVDPSQLNVGIIDDLEPYLDGRRELIRSARRKYGFDE